MAKQFPRSKLLILFHEQNGKCFYCGTELVEDCRINKPPHIDHINPKSNGGGNEKENLCLSCYFCNISKGGKSEEEFKEYLKPLFEGKCSRKELSDYHKWENLNKKFL